MNFVPPSDIFIGPVKIHLYALMVALAVLAAWLTAFKICHRFKVSKKSLDQSIFWVLLPGFVGARLYYVIFQWDYFSQNPDRVVAFWDGGMAIYGGLIGAVLGLFVFTRLYKKPFWNFAGLFAVVAPLGQAIGRWGNFFNQEAFGSPTTLPWGIFIEEVYRPAIYRDFQYFHPTFLYESLWNLVVFLALLRFTKNKPKPAKVAAYYLLLYAPVRFLIEGIRTDSLYFFSFRVSQIVSLLAVAFGLWIFFIFKESESESAAN